MLTAISKGEVAKTVTELIESDVVHWIKCWIQDVKNRKFLFTCCIGLGTHCTEEKKKVKL